MHSCSAFHRPWDYFVGLACRLLLLFHRLWLAYVCCQYCEMPLVFPVCFLSLFGSKSNAGSLRNNLRFYTVYCPNCVEHLSGFHPRRWLFCTELLQQCISRLYGTHCPLRQGYSPLPFVQKD